MRRCGLLSGWIWMMSLVLLLTGCGDSGKAPFVPESPGAESGEPRPEEQPDRGEGKTFGYNGLVLEVSHVKEVVRRTLKDDSGGLWVYETFVLYPGAVMTVLDADMMEDAEDGLPHADWAVYTAADERIDIVNGMAPVEITEEILGVFDPESSLYVLGFEMCAE